MDSVVSGSRADSAYSGSGWEPQQAPRGQETSSGSVLDLAVYWRVAVKHRFMILGAVLAATVLGVVVTLLMTPVYTAATTLQIDREAARVFNVEEVSPQESMIQGEEFFQTQYGLLRSRSLAERVVDGLGLASNDGFLEAMGVTPPEAGSTAADTSRRRREAVIKVVQDNLGVVPARGSRLVTLTFDSPDPALAARIANAFAQNFIQANLDRKYESSSYARQFLEERIAQTKARLEDAERELVGYATTNQIINVGEEGQESGQSRSLATSSLVALNDALAAARARRVAAEQRWMQARAVPLTSLPEVLSNPTIQRLTEDRAKLRAEYQQKSQIFQEDFPEMQQLQARLEETNAQIRSLASEIRASLRQAYDVARSEELGLERQVAGATGDVLALRNRSIQYNILQREIDTTRTLYEGLLQRYKEVGVTGGLSTNNVSIVDQAQTPSRPSKPNLLLNLVLSVAFGLGLGILAAVIAEALDETLATPEDVESKLGLPLLAVIPLLDKGTSPQEALADVRSNFSEAYYSLRTALQFSTPNGAPANLLVTSSRPAEGKSTTAYATALNLARLGRRVLLADGDLRNPSMHRVVGVENDMGMSNLLSGGAELGSLTKPTSHQNLDFIPCGPLPPNPAELWGGDRLKLILQEAARTYDHVVIDGPPVLGFADAPLLASAVGGTVFVLEAKGTRRAQAKGALRRLAVGNGHILGAVLSKFNTKTVQYGGYDYAYDYHYGPGSTSSGKGRKAGKR
ncbi:GumC family protein [Brevundimonas sp.]|uniref:GumC family protein n=1 Tax=Brevundimonas sp. TaxID=1871086 RepID=UPI0035ADD352